MTESGRSEGFALDRQSLKKGEHFTQFFIERSFPSGSHVALKVDLINDIAVRYGSLAHDSILGKIDDWRNILWISPLDPDGFPRICAQMAEDILLGRANTLHSR